MKEKKQSDLIAVSFTLNRVRLFDESREDRLNRMIETDRINFEKGHHVSFPKQKWNRFLIAACRNRFFLFLFSFFFIPLSSKNHRKRERKKTEKKKRKKKKTRNEERNRRWRLIVTKLFWFCWDFLFFFDFLLDFLFCFVCFVFFLTLDRPITRESPFRSLLFASSFFFLFFFCCPIFVSPIFFVLVEKRRFSRFFFVFGFRFFFLQKFPVPDERNTKTKKTATEKEIEKERKKERKKERQTETDRQAEDYRKNKTKEQRR